MRFDAENAGWKLDEAAGDRFWEKVNFHGGTAYAEDPLVDLSRVSGECWRWTGRRNPDEGYGRFRMIGREFHAHRVSYLDHGHEIPAGMVLDHLCRQRDCVNPEHLEPVTDAVNRARGILPTRRKAACKRGHAYTPENTITQKAGTRTCLTCRRDLQRARRASSRAEKTYN